MTRQHIHIHHLHPRQPNKSRSQRFTAVNCTLCTASFPPLPPKQHNFFYVATLLLLIVIFDCCFLWRYLFNPFALSLLFHLYDILLPMPAPPLSLRIHRFAQYPLFVLILFCRAPTSPHTSHVSTFCRLYSSWQCRGAHFFAFSFHVEHTSCHSPKPQRLSRFLLVYAYLYITSLHVFRLCVCFFRPCDPFPVVAPRLTIAPRRRSAAFVSEPLIAARLAVFVGARLHSVFSLPRLPLFDFSISFCLTCPMAHANFLFVFLCLRLFALSLRGSAPHLRPSLIRLHLKRSPLPNLDILLDTVPLLLYNYLAFACDTVFFVFFRLCKEARRDRLADNRLRRRSPNTTK